MSWFNTLLYWSYCQEHTDLTQCYFMNFNRLCMPTLRYGFSHFTQMLWALVFFSRLMLCLFRFHRQGNLSTLWIEKLNSFSAANLMSLALVVSTWFARAVSNNKKLWKKWNKRESLRKEILTPSWSTLLTHVNSLMIDFS